MQTPDLSGLGEQVEALLKSTVSPDAILRAKQRRFTTSARLLAKKHNIDVHVVDAPEQAPAWYEMRKKQMYLNEACPRTQDAVSALIYDRGKLFHELFHELFTRDVKYRAALADKSKNKTMFLDISNILEDGRIEWFGKQKWEGAGAYLDTLLLEAMRGANAHPITGLVLYVRKGKWRNEKEGQFWAPFEAKVDKAIRALSTRKVCDIAFEITEAIADLEPKQPKTPTNPQDPQGEPTEGTEGGQGKAPNGPTCPDCGLPISEEQAKKLARPEAETMHMAIGQACPTCGQIHGDTDTEGQGGEAGDDPDDDDGDDDGDTEAEQGGGNGSGASDNLDVLDPEVREEIDKIVQHAKDKVRAEAEEDYASILEEAMTEVEPDQPFASGEEEMLADDLARMFNSLLVEANREKRHEAREGKLNTLALPKALTNQRCFERSEIAPAPPYVALLLDVSGSMRYSVGMLTRAARVIHGALLKAKVEVLTATFSSGRFTRHATIPEKPFRAMGGTPTGEAMKAANEWLTEQGANRALVIVVTDGEPASAMTVYRERQAIEDNGGTTLGVLLGGYAPPDADQQFNDWILCDDLASLPTLLEPKLSNFMAGV